MAERSRQVLYALVDRLIAGEFDAIVASLPPSPSSQDTSRLVRLQLRRTGMTVQPVKERIAIFYGRHSSNLQDDGLLEGEDRR